MAEEVIEIRSQERSENIQDGTHRGRSRRNSEKRYNATPHSSRKGYTRSRSRGREFSGENHRPSRSRERTSKRPSSHGQGGGSGGRDEDRNRSRSRERRTSKRPSSHGRGGGSGGRDEDRNRSRSRERRTSKRPSSHGRGGGSGGRDEDRIGSRSRSGGSGSSGHRSIESNRSRRSYLSGVSSDSDGLDHPIGVLTLKKAFEPLFKLFGMRATGNIFKDFGLLADALENEIDFARAIFGFIFDAYDEDNSGNIHEDELGHLIHDIGEATGDQTLKHIPKENIRAIMDILDDDGNGEIDKKEFVDYMVSWLELGDDDGDDVDDSDTDSSFF